MARPRKLTDEEIAAAQVMWLARERRKIIASRFGVDRETIRRAVIKIAAKPQTGVMRQDIDSLSDVVAPQVAVPSNR